MKINVSEFLRGILPKCKSDTELDHWLLQECRERFGAEHAAGYKAISDVLARRAANHGGSRLAAASKLAAGSAVMGFGTTTTRKVYNSLDEMPPDVRQHVEQMLREGKTSAVSDSSFRWESPDGRPPPPEIAEALRAQMGAESADLPPGLRAEVGGGNALKWILVLIALLLIVGIALLFTFLRG